MNQTGFIFPLTTLICFLICTVTLYQIDAYLTEKRFIYEQERMMQLESLLQVAIRDFQKAGHEPNVNENHIFSYEPGTVTLVIRDYQNGLSHISVRATLATGHERLAGFYYRWEDASVEQYWEGSNRATSLLHHWVYGFR